MMTRLELADLQSQAAFLKRCLESSPPPNAINRITIACRLEDVQQLIEEGIKSGIAELMHTTIRFSGPPVTDRRGIGAVFASQALQEYQDIVQAVGEKMLGPRDFNLMVTGTVPGSFGFTFESSSKTSTAQEHSPLDIVIEKINEILLASVQSDDSLAEAVADVDEEVVARVRDFVKFLADKDTTCSIDFRGKKYPISDVRQSVSRLSSYKVEPVKLQGMFHVALSDGAVFRLLMLDEKGGEEEISGKISSRIDSEEIKTWGDLYNNDKRVEIEARKTVIGSSRPSYVMTSAPRLIDGE